MDEERIKTGAKIWAMKKALEREISILEKNECFSSFLQEKLEEQQLATSGMIHLYTKENLENYCKNFNLRAVFFFLMHLLPLKEN